MFPTSQCLYYIWANWMQCAIKKQNQWLGSNKRNGFSSFSLVPYLAAVCCSSHCSHSHKRVADQLVSKKKCDHLSYNIWTNPFRILTKTSLEFLNSLSKWESLCSTVQIVAALLLFFSLFFYNGAFGSTEEKRFSSTLSSKNKSYSTPSFFQRKVPTTYQIAGVL